MSPNPFFLISILVSAILAFATVALIIEMVLIVLSKFPRANCGRVRVVLRTLPFVSLFFDLVSSSLSIGNLFNPLNCSSCVQKVVLHLFFPDLKIYLYSNEISLVRYLGEEISHTIFNFIGLALAILTGLLVLLNIIKLIISYKKLCDMERNSIQFNRTVNNPILDYILKKQKIKIFSCNKVESPLATYSKKIFVPNNLLSTLTQEEFEAVLAHEVEHILWMDSYLRIFALLISSIFWWVPTYAWRKRLEFDQEVACDEGILRYGYKGNELASALLKVCKDSKEKSNTLLCYFKGKKHDTLRRLELLITKGSRFSYRIEWISFILVLLFIIITIICSVL